MPKIPAKALEKQLEVLTRNGALDRMSANSPVVDALGDLIASTFATSPGLSPSGLDPWVINADSGYMLIDIEADRPQLGMTYNGEQVIVLANFPQGDGTNGLYIFEPADDTGTHAYSFVEITDTLSSASLIYADDSHAFIRMNGDEGYQLFATDLATGEMEGLVNPDGFVFDAFAAFAYGEQTYVIGATGPFGGIATIDPNPVFPDSLNANLAYAERDAIVDPSTAGNGHVFVTNTIGLGYFELDTVDGVPVYDKVILDSGSSAITRTLALEGDTLYAHIRDFDFSAGGETHAIHQVTVASDGLTYAVDTPLYELDGERFAGGPARDFIDPMDILDMGDVGDDFYALINYNNEDSPGSFGVPEPNAIGLFLDRGNGDEYIALDEISSVNGFAEVGSSLYISGNGSGLSELLRYDSVTDTLDVLDLVDPETGMDLNPAIVGSIDDSVLFTHQSFTTVYKTYALEGDTVTVVADAILNPSGFGASGVQVFEGDFVA